MGSMFTKQDKQDLVDQIEKLRDEIAGLRAERRALTEELGLAGQVIDLKRDISDLEITKSRLTEDHAREKREVTHMVGLEKKRQAFEIEQAKRDTTVTVREENLVADRKRFDEQMTFTTDRFQKEVKYLKELMSQVLDRLPTVTVDRSIGEKEKDAA